MSTPTVPVTVTLAAQDGTPYAGVTVRARLDINEVYQGFVISDQADAVTDAGGVAVLNCFPNAPSPTGLGTQGSTYRFWAAIPGGRSLNVEALVPNTACRLENILLTTDSPSSLTDAQLAVAQAQSSVTTAATSAAAAAGSATTASGQAGVATAQAGIATTQAGIATTQAGNAETSASASDTSANLSQAWATQLAPEVVAGQGYGAKKYAQDASASAGAAADDANAATAQANIATIKATEAKTARDDALAAVATGGVVKFYDTYAAAIADVATPSLNAIVEVFADENKGGRRSLYQKTGSSTLTWKCFADGPQTGGSGLGAAIRKLKGTMVMVGDSNTDDVAGRPGWQAAVNAEWKTTGGIFESWTCNNIGLNGASLLSWVSTIPAGNSGTATTTRGNIWAAVNANPDIIILSLGTNDIRTATTRASEGTQANLRANLATLINFCLAKAPKACVWLRLPNPLAYAPATYGEGWASAAEARTYNASLRTVYNEWCGASDRVEVYDSHADLFGLYADAVTDSHDPYTGAALLEDSLHAGGLGFRRVTQRMAAQASPVVRKSPLVNVPPLTNTAFTNIFSAVWYKTLYIESAIPFTYDGTLPGVLMRLDTKGGLQNARGKTGYVTDSTRSGSLSESHDFELFYDMGKANAVSQMLAIPGSFSMYVHSTGTTYDFTLVRLADTISGDNRYIFQETTNAQPTFSGLVTIFVTDYKKIPSFNPQLTVSVTVNASGQRFALPSHSRYGSQTFSSIQFTRSGDDFNVQSGGAAQTAVLANGKTNTGQTSTTIATPSWAANLFQASANGPFTFAPGAQSCFSLTAGANSSNIFPVNVAFMP